VANASVDGDTVLRLKVCGHPECRAVFTICVSCDRGQRYCGAACRSAVRRRQRHDANQRYQQSEQGRDTHRHCQRRYREGAAKAPVTDQVSRLEDRFKSVNTSASVTRVKSLVNYRVGLFVRVPEEIGPANRPVNRETSVPESRASGSYSCCRTSDVLIPEELLSITFA
jgi:hypothetical protein